jgi:acyl-CoA reductase-like NAD-dependent aldehyde dehydrogenase
MDDAARCASCYDRPVSANVLRVDNPFTGEIVLERPLSDAKAIEEQMRRSNQTHRDWAQTSLSHRLELVEAFCKLFEERGGQYAEEISRSMGKPISEARGEVRGMLDRARQMASIAEESLADLVLPPKDGFERWIAREPVGVVVVLAAWNYPLLIAINPTVAAILAGNSVVLKHSSRTPRCGEQIAETFKDAGAPADLVTAVHTDHKVAETLVGHPLTGYVSFTGSVGGGRKIYRAVADKRFIDVGLELGGKDPAYVLEDADFEPTVANVVEGAFYNAGQSCCGIERVYVARSIYEKFLEAAIEEAKKYQPGDPLDEATSLGPMAQSNAPAFLKDQVDGARAAGARIPIGGEATTYEGRGRFFAPTIAADTDHRMAIAREESFGPVVAIQAVEDDEEAISRMNDSEFGLTASVWTGDTDRAKHILRRLEAGTVFLNRADFLDPLLAWTGVKDTGKGASLSKLGFLSVTRPKRYHLRLRF